MQGSIISHIDIAQALVVIFFVFFAGLVLHLRQEDKREGYPLKDPAGGPDAVGFPPMPAPKSFLLLDGAVVTAPHAEHERPFAARRQFPFPGAPITPTGDPLQDGVGPAAFVDRKDEPIIWNEDQRQMAPLRALSGWSLGPDDPDPRGMEVIGSDGAVAGVVADVWIDRSVKIVRYLEVETAPGAPPALLPIYHADIRRRQNRVKVRAVRAAQFNDAPRLREPDRITAREEDRVNAFYAGGRFFNETADAPEHA